MEEGRPHLVKQQQVAMKSPLNCSVRGAQIRGYSTSAPISLHQVDAWPRDPLIPRTRLNVSDCRIPNTPVHTRTHLACFLLASEHSPVWSTPGWRRPHTHSARAYMCAPGLPLASKPALELQ